MRILVMGAGAVGGYLAARLLEAGADVTLLVRERRKRQLEETGLVVRSPSGDYNGRPRIVTAGQGTGGDGYDLVILAMKAYGLEDALAELQPYVGPDTALLPFLNGIRQMERIAATYPGRPLLGGVARIEATLSEEGHIVHTAPYHSFTYGKYGDAADACYGPLQEQLRGLSVLREHPDITRDLWEKYLLITALSGLTTLFDASVGEIREAPGGMAPFRRLYEEAERTIRAAGGRLGDGVAAKQLETIAGLSFGSTSSMLRDLRHGLPTEAAHIHGHLLELARRHGIETPLLETVYQRLAIYERKRNAPAG